tara:strand:+ start:792 stop:1409 length:618 start_codon:yes stop_codon:yes gene_type:complete
MIDIENVFYINLKERLDRKENIENQLNTLGWKYTRFDAIKNKNGKIGCSLSHLKLLQHAKKENLPYILILEDDIKFTNIHFFKSQLEEFLNSNINYDVYLLAGNVQIPIKIIKPGILKIFKSFTTTGYIVKNHYYDKLIENIKEGVINLIQNPNNEWNAIDVFWIKLQEKDNWYISYPRTNTQLPHYSDIKQKNINYDHLMLDIF